MKTHITIIYYLNDILNDIRNDIDNNDGIVTIIALGGGGDKFFYHKNARNDYI